MSEQQSPEEFYKNFKIKLEESTQFPGEYIYKFIVPSENKLIAEVQRVFDNARPQFQMKNSANGKYTSVTVVIYALDADAVIHYYKEASTIEGIVML